MVELRLVGFVADLAGNEDFLLTAEPIVSNEGRKFVAHGRHWTVESLRPVSTGEERFANFLKDDDTEPIEEGHVVWLAGRNFVSDVLSHSSLVAFSREIGSPRWKLHSRGYKWRTGPIREFDDRRVQLANILESQLHRQLFDQLEKTLGDLASTFRLYLALATERTKSRYLNIALYHFEMRDTYALGLTRHRAVINGDLFADASTFDQELAQLRSVLTAARLDEVVEDRLSTSHSYRLPNGEEAHSKHVESAVRKSIAENWADMYGSGALSTLFERYLATHNGEESDDDLRAELGIER
ncbi:hypothetical protein [Aeromicrobium sp. 9AM]|uniref:hypothetical protein n=1 Tax=Aeromicrobium sp. 9AM TaxID=2653126 RepID=UPI0012F04C51|nr:hypothetical protein [Aeromicrobium sp. 9AM]VXB34137.1 hypothetical protein AERO9AM_11042 [Aeromicrobium sp. 9AM]